MLVSYKSLQKCKILIRQIQNDINLSLPIKKQVLLITPPYELMTEILSVRQEKVSFINFIKIVLEIINYTPPPPPHTQRQKKSWLCK